MRSKKAWAVVLALVAVGTGLALEEASVAANMEVDDGAVSSLAPHVPALPAGEVTYDDVLAAMGEAVPGFGGAYVEGDSLVGQAETLHIWLTDPDAVTGTRARDVLAAALGPRFAQERIITHRADFTFEDLKAWREQAAEVLSLPGAAFTDVDETKNRIVVAVEDPVVHGTAVRALMEDVGVPAAAVEVQQGTPFTPLLRSRRRPLRGGLEISFQSGFLGLETPTCTLGYPATRGGVEGFVTNSHCSRTQGEVDNGRYWQPERPVSQGDQVGTETVDPAYSSSLTGCPTGRRCRRSDSNFVDGATNIGRGTIARIGTGSTTWDGTSLWRISAAGSAALNQVATKVGKTTGLTSGLVTNTCVNGLVDGSDIAILCDVIAEIWSDAGDSGSPVFLVTNSPQTHDVTALGILWGKGTSNGVDISIFSGITETKDEIGGSLAVCASGFSC